MVKDTEGNGCTKMKVVLLGAAGMVGSSIIRQIKKSRENVFVHALVRNEGQACKEPFVKNFYGDMEHIPDGLIPGERHIIIHFASKLKDKDGTGYQVNLDGIENLKKYVNKYTAGIIYGSSASVYGQGEQCHTGEDQTLHPQTDLACMRRLCEESLAGYARKEHFTLYILRTRFMVGKGDRYIVPYFQKRLESPVQYGMGRQKFTIIDNDDYARIILILAKKAYEEKARPFENVRAMNVGYKDALTYKEIKKILGYRRKLQVRLPARLAVWFYGTVAKDRDRKTKAELFGYSHYLNVERLEKEISSGILLRNPAVVFEKAVREYKKECNYERNAI